MLRDIFPRDEAERRMNLIREAVWTRASIDLGPEQGSGEDGERIDPVLDENGVVTAIRMISFDPPQQGKDREKGQARDRDDLFKRFRLIADRSTDVMWEIDLAARRYTYVSPSVMKLRGYAPDEVMALPVSESMIPSSWEKFAGRLANMEALVKAGTWKGFSEPLEIEQGRRDGSTVLTEASTFFVTDEAGRPSAIIGISRDISERRKSEEAVMSLARFPGEDPNPVLRTTLDGKLIYANEPARVFLRTLGKEADEPLPQQVNEVIEIASRGTAQWTPR